MDQQKILRLLRLLLLLSGKRRYSKMEIQEKFGISGRTVTRYLETFESAGLIVDRSQNTYRLQQDNSSTRSLQRLLHFTEEEVYIMEELIEQIEGESAIKRQLLRKLNSLYDIGALSRKEQSNEHEKIGQISNAIRDKKQIRIINYHSSNSAVISDRAVEAFDFLPGYEGVWCYELEKRV